MILTTNSKTEKEESSISKKEYESSTSNKGEESSTSNKESESSSSKEEESKTSYSNVEEEKKGSSEKSLTHQANRRILDEKPKINIYVDLSSENVPSVIKEQGYYDYYYLKEVLSNSVGLLNSNSKQSENLNRRNEGLIAINREHAGSIEPIPNEVIQCEDAKNEDPIEVYTQKTGRTGGDKVDKKEYKLDKFRFNINLSNKVDKEVIEISPKFSKLPDIYKLCFEHVSSDNKKVKIFFGHVAPSKLQKFTLTGGDPNKKGNELCNTEYYSKEIHSILSRTTDEVMFRYCIISNSDLQSIFRAGSNLKYLKFDHCKFNILNDFDISGPYYNMKNLWMFDCGGSMYSNWYTNPERLKSLAGGICNSTLKDCIKLIWFIDAESDKDEVKKIFKKLSLPENLLCI